MSFTHCHSRAHYNIEQYIIRLALQVVQEKLIVDDKRCKGMIGIVAIEALCNGSFAWCVLHVRALSGLLVLAMDIGERETQRFVFAKEFDEEILFVGLGHYGVIGNFAAQTEWTAGRRSASCGQSDDVNLLLISVSHTKQVERARPTGRPSHSGLINRLA